MGSAFALVLVACAASCYQSPSLSSCKYRCGGANNNSCPSGYECNAGMCVTPGTICDGDGGVIDDGREPDGVIDMMTIDAPQCTNPDVNVWLERPLLATGTGLAQIVVLDANNDNILDLVALDGNETIGTFSGNGDGTFGARQISSAAPTGSNVKKLITGDFDLDGQRDDVLGLQSGGEPALVTLASNGTGTFTRTAFALPSNALDFGNAGDVDGTGTEDVIVLFSGASARLQVYRRTDSPVWTAGSMTSTNTMATSAFVGRVNTGGITDAVVTMTDTNQIGIHAGSGSTSAYALAALSVANAPSAVRAVAGQLRSTGTPSIVTVSPTTDSVAIRHINGVAGTTDGGTLAVGDKAVAVILANVVGDALPEIITADSGANTFTVLRNEDSTFAAGVATPAGNAPSDLVAGDFDRDGRLDLAVANIGADTISIFLNRCEP